MQTLKAATLNDWQHAKELLSSTDAPALKLAHHIVKNQGCTTSVLRRSVKGGGNPNAIRKANAVLYAAGLFIHPKPSNSNNGTNHWCWFCVALPRDREAIAA